LPAWDDVITGEQEQEQDVVLINSGDRKNVRDRNGASNDYPAR
jgi:hypothetical protein